MGIAWVVFRENVDRRLLLGASAILAGAVALSWQGQGVRVDEGGLLIAAACWHGASTITSREDFRRRTRS
jgi:drug/metabolite transporter (DMT)-like permease